MEGSIFFSILNNKREEVKQLKKYIKEKFIFIKKNPIKRI